MTKPFALAYSVHVSRDDRFWLLTFPDLGEGHVSQVLEGDSIDRIVETARDYIAVTLDVDPDRVIIGSIRVDLDAVDDFAEQV